MSCPLQPLSLLFMTFFCLWTSPYSCKSTVTTFFNQAHLSTSQHLAEAYVIHLHWHPIRILTNSTGASLVCENPFDQNRGTIKTGFRVCVQEGFSPQWEPAGFLVWGLAAVTPLLSSVGLSHYAEAQRRTAVVVGFSTGVCRRQQNNVSTLISNIIPYIIGLYLVFFMLKSLTAGTDIIQKTVAVDN